MDEAVTLLLKASRAKAKEDKTAQKKVMCMTQILGFLALANVQAGAYIRQGYFIIEEYCDLYNHCRQKLLQYRSAQMNTGYGYSMYTTWEISIKRLRICPTRLLIMLLNLSK